MLLSRTCEVLNFFAADCIKFVSKNDLKSESSCFCSWVDVDRVMFSLTGFVLDDMEIPIIINNETVFSLIS